MVWKTKEETTNFLLFFDAAEATETDGMTLMKREKIKPKVPMLPRQPAASRGRRRSRTRPPPWRRGPCTKDCRCLCRPPHPRLPPPLRPNVSAPMPPSWAGRDCSRRCLQSRPSASDDGDRCWRWRCFAVAGWANLNRPQPQPPLMRPTELQQRPPWRHRRKLQQRRPDSRLNSNGRRRRRRLHKRTKSRTTMSNVTSKTMRWWPPSGHWTLAPPVTSTKTRKTNCHTWTMSTTSRPPPPPPSPWLAPIQTSGKRRNGEETTRNKSPFHFGRRCRQTVSRYY